MRLPQLTLALILILSQQAFSQRFWVASTASNWNNTANWSNVSGGAGGFSVPGAGDVVTFNATRNGNCLIDVPVNIAGITVNGYTGTIDLNGFVLTSAGTITFTTGTINNSGGTGNINLNSIGTTTFNGTQFGAAITGTTGRVSFNGSVFNNSVSIIKTVGTLDSSTGNNTFQSSFAIVNNSTSSLRMATTTRDIFNGTVDITTSNTGSIDFAYSSAGNQFNNNISITYNSTAAVTFGGTTGTSTLAATRSITVAGFGASGSGNLTLARFTQTGATAQAITLGGNNTSTITIGPSSNFGGSLTINAPSIVLNSTSFQALTITKTGSQVDNNRGGNTFNGLFSLTNQGGDFLMGTSVTDAADIWNADATFLNTGGNRIRIGEDNAGNTFNANATFTITSTTDVASRIQISRFATSSTIFNGTTTFNNFGNASDVYVSYDAGSVTTFNGPFIYNINVNTAVGEHYFGYNGNAIFASDLTVNNAATLAENIYFSGGTGIVTFGNGTITVNPFTQGSLLFRNFTQTGSTAQNIVLAGTAALNLGPATTFNGNVDFKAPQIFMNGATYNGTTAIEKTGTTANTGTGANIFAGTTTITNSGTGVLRTNGGNTFNGTTSIINNGSADILLELVTGDTFNGDLTITNAGTSNVRMCYAGTNAFNGNIVVNSLSGTGIVFCESVSATATLNSRTITIGGSGFSSGTLNLQRFTQVGAVNQTLTSFSGNATLSVGPSSAFGGNVNFAAPQILLNGCTYSGTATIEKNGATDNVGVGGNIFNGITTITNSGSGYLLLGNGTRDQFNAATTFNNTGSYRIYFAHNHPGQTTTFASDLTLNANKTAGTDAWAYLIAENGTSGLSVAGNLVINCAGGIQSNYRFLNGGGSIGTYGGLTTIDVTNTSVATTIIMGQTGTSTYNGDISLSNTGGSAGIVFNNGATASSTLTGYITSSGYTSGSLNLFRFTQIGTASPINLTLTNNGTLLQVGPSSQFDANVTFVSPRLLLNGSTYKGTAYLEKNGNTDDAGSGGNVFESAATLVNSGSGYLLSANVNPDIFNSDVTVNNTGSNYIYLAHNVAGNQFNGNITLSSTGSSLGIRFSNNSTGFSTFNAGATNRILIGAGGYSVGELRLRRFTQTGTSSQAFTLTGSAQLFLGAGSQFDGDVNFIAPRLFLNGATYNGVTYLEKNGAISDDGAGGNVFNQQTTLVNSGNGYLLTASTSPDTFNNKLIVINSGSSTIRLSDNSAGNQFRGNVELNSTFGGGIYFGNQAAGTSTLTAGNTISVGTTGVISGDIRLIRFTQLGATAQTLNLTGIAILTLGPSSRFDGDVDFRSPQLLLNGTTYNGTAYLEKKGATDNAGNGGNVFNGATSLVDSGSGYLLTANASPDIFNSTLTVTNTGSNIIYLAHNVGGSQFNGHVTFNSTLGSLGVYFANNITGNATLGTGASLLVGGLGFSSGELRLRRFTQTGSSSQTLVLTGTALLRIGPSSTFNGVLDFRAPRLGLDGCTYNGITYLEKTGATTDNSSGGNAFNGETTLANSGSGILATANTALDTFNGDLTLTNTGSASIRMADNIGGSLFNGNIIVNSTNSTAGSGIFFSNNAVAANATLASGKTITVGATGFTAGELRLIRFTQLGTTAQNLTLTGTSLLQLGATSVFNGDVTFRAPQLLLNSTTFNRSSYLEKTGAANNTGTGGATFGAGFTATIVNIGTGVLRTNGGNTFNGTTTILNSGTADILLELTTGSTYNGDVTMTNTGTSNIRVAYTGANIFNGNIIVNSTAGSGITFCETVTGTATLNNATISVGGSGFTTGVLQINRFTQNGAVAQNITLTSSATFRNGGSSLWNGSLSVTAPSLFLDGITTLGATNSFTKTGNTTDASNGGNTFGGTTSFTNSGAGIFRLANAAADSFTGDVTFNLVSGTIEPGFNVASTFQGNVTVNSSTSITFGANTGGITFSGGNLQTVNRSGTAIPIFRRLTMSKSGGAVTLNTNVRITTSATFTTGVINTSTGNLVSFANGATTSAGSVASHIDGPVEKIGNAAFTFPTGDNGFFRAISITAPTLTTDAYTAEYLKANHPYGTQLTYAGGITNVSTCEYWLLNRTVGTTNVNVTLSWTKADCSGAYITDISKLLVTRWNGTNWLNLGGTSITGTTTSGTVTSTTANTFSLNPSPITLASSTSSNPLPIQLLRFTAKALGSTVELDWSTATEENNDYFNIQRSIDGNEFVDIGRVKGAGTSYSQIDYHYADTQPLPGLVYYRLKQTDFDLKSTYSDMVSVDVDATADFVITPNFGKAGVEMKLSAQGEYVVYNSLGVIVQRVQQASLIDTDSMVSGVYFVRNNKGKVQRIVIN